MRKRIIAFVMVFLIAALPFSIAETFSYDENGNLIENVNAIYEYDSFNNLVRVNDSDGTLLEEYTYDDEGNRLTKYENLTDTTTYYLDDNLVRVVNTSGTFDMYYYHDDFGTLLSRKDPDGSIYYYHPDHLGSTSVITDEDGDLVEKTEYEPFGGIVEGGSDRYTFTGQELDLSGLMYYGARYYDTKLRQFVQPDSLLPDIYDPQALNRYAYVLNNPYKYVDPTGNYWETPIDVASIWNSLNDLWEDPSSGWNWLALAADVGTTLLPGAAGGGFIVKGSVKGGKAAKNALKYGNKVDEGVKTADKITEIGKHQFKHVKKSLSEKQLMKSTANDHTKSLFSNKINYENIVQEGYGSGTKIHDSLRVFDAKKTVGYSKGKSTRYVAVRSNDLGNKIDVHGYPIPESEYLKQLKKVKR